MITAQDIKEKTFEKAVFGGYDMGAVDDFLEECAEGFASLSKENLVLKSKMKVLVEKIEEYRSTEDAMRLALLSAQKMSVQIESEARARAESIAEEAEKNSRRMISEAESASRDMLRDAKRESATEQARLNEAKRSAAGFIGEISRLCKQQLEYLEALALAQPAAPQAAAAAEPAPVIESPTRRIDVAPAAIPAQEPPAADEPTRRFEAQRDAQPDIDAIRFEIG